MVIQEEIYLSSIIMAFMQLIAFVLLACDNNLVHSLTCGGRKCGFGTFDNFCHRLRPTECRCKRGFIARQTLTTFPDVEICLEVCEKTRHCPNNKSCIDRSPGLDACKCDGGYLQTPHGQCVVPPIENDRSWVGLSVGVTFGVLAFLSIIIGAILIRRRRMCCKLSKGTAEFVDRPVETIESSNGVIEIPQTKLREANLVEHSVDKILPRRNKSDEKADFNKSTKKTGEPEGEGVYSAIFKKRAHCNNNNNSKTDETATSCLNPAAFNRTASFDQSGAYDTLVVCTLNTKINCKSGTRMDEDLKPSSTSGISGEVGNPDNGHAYSTVKVSDLNSMD